MTNFVFECDISFFYFLKNMFLKFLNPFDEAVVDFFQYIYILNVKYIYTLKYIYILDVKNDFDYLFRNWMKILFLIS